MTFFARIKGWSEKGQKKCPKTYGAPFMAKYLKKSSRPQCHLLRTGTIMEFFEEKLRFPRKMGIFWGKRLKKAWCMLYVIEQCNFGLPAKVCQQKLVYSTGSQRGGSSKLPKFANAKPKPKSFSGFGDCQDFYTTNTKCRSACRGMSIGKFGKNMGR